MNSIVLNDGSRDIIVGMSVEDAMMDRLVEMTREVGRMLTFDEVSAEPKMPRPNEYATVCGFKSFTDAAEKAWHKVQVERGELEGASASEEGPGQIQVGAYSTKKAQMDGFEKLNPKRRPIKTMHEEMESRRELRQEKESEAKDMNKYNRRWSTEEVKDAIRRLYEEEGRIPTVRELRSAKFDYLPSFQVIFHHLGPKDSWLEAIGIAEEPEAEDEKNPVMDLIEEAEEQIDASAAEIFGLTEEKFGEIYDEIKSQDDVLSEEEVGTLLGAVNAVAEDEPDEEAVEEDAVISEDAYDDDSDAFEASGEIESSEEAGTKEADLATAGIELQAAVHKMLEDFTKKVEIRGAIIKVSVWTKDTNEQVTVKVEF